MQLSDAGDSQAVITNLYGSVTSSVAVLTFGSQPLGFNGDALSWTVNQNGGFYVYSRPAIAGNLLTLTDGGGSEARSVFFNSPQYIGTFKAQFTYQAGGNKGADGMAFCLQNDPRAPSAIGGGGGQLGVGASTPIAPSVELELNLDAGSGQHVGYTVLTNGLTGAGGGNGNYQVPGNVQMNSGDPINVTLDYANRQLAVGFTDTITHASFTTNLGVGDFTQVLGTNTAYVGFTGADGAATSIQTISNFSFLSIPSASIQPHDANVLISWPGGAPGYTLQKNPDLTRNNWDNVTNLAVSTNGQNEVTVPANSTSMFYRLALPAPYEPARER